jgi:pimeloyl-ACP methyl ester carboxylesterase
VVLPDGRIVTPPLTEGESYIWPRVADIRFLMDQMPSIEGFHFDNTNVGLFGHSRGGYVSVITAVVDPRVKAAANMDGFFWGVWTKNGSTGLGQFPVEFQEKARSCRTPVLRLQSDQGSVEAARAVFERESADVAGPFTYASMNGFKHGSFTFSSAAVDGESRERRALVENVIAEFFGVGSTKTLKADWCAKFERE